MARPPSPTSRASLVLHLAGGHHDSAVYECGPDLHLWAAPNRAINPGDPVLHDFGQLNSSFILWTVDLPVGQNVSFTYVRTADPTNLFASDIAYTVVPGPNSSCLSSTSSNAPNTTSGLTSASPLVSSSPSTLENSSPTSTVTSTSSNPTRIATSTNSSSKRTATSTIIGAAIGGAVAAILFAASVAAWFRHRARMRSRAGKSAYEHSLLEAGDESDSGFPPPRETAQLSSESALPVAPLHPYMLKVAGHDMSSVHNSLSSSATPSKSADGSSAVTRGKAVVGESIPSLVDLTSPVAAAPERGQRAVDAGIVLASGDSGLLPPAYEDVSIRPREDNQTVARQTPRKP
ncbi:hypothetical protein A0H81_01538 [Grifola frondosa]|uniref:Uncharacterized protein n=1 Tax=Grifola frondosa TaxID=5627 RepID=A0A1C7MTT0_GRIFR|nr:hypothetical protein A0H81_01538 [Grifola frondosa]